MAVQKGHKFDYVSPLTFAIRGARISLAKCDKQGTVLERFWNKVQKTDACWLWVGAKDAAGYGMFRPYGRRASAVRAHRFALELQLGRPIAPGFKALHDCDVPACVRHIYEGTSVDNARDRDRRGRFVDWRKC